MGKVTGFIEHSRALPKNDDPSLRVNHYKEFIHTFSDESLNQQASRCMDCGVPFCHSGCPLGNFIPDFNDAVYNKKWEEAYHILADTNNFPEFTGRLCPAPCEKACVLGINQPAVTIEEIEKHIIEIAFEKQIVQPYIPTTKTNKKVAVVGSGPAGLAVADQLCKANHQVVVYEKDEAIGGLLRFGIPDFKLEKSIIDRRLELLIDQGIEFKTKVKIGENISLKDLSEEYDAVVLAMGSNEPRNLQIKGRELDGVHYAMEFLTQQNRRNAQLDFSEKDILATGKNVIVIGGGDTGSDCIGTSNRQKAKLITQFELMPKPPKDRPSYQPWPNYPMSLKISSSHEEGCERIWNVQTKAFVGDSNNKLKALKICDVVWENDENGRPLSFKEVPNTEREIPCELALLAMGFVHVKHDNVVNNSGFDKPLELDKRGNILANEENYKTNLDNVFACGDTRRGQSLIVWAISEGRECAKQVDVFLNNSKSHLASKDSSLLSLEAVG